MNKLVSRNGLLPTASFFDDFLTRDLINWPGWTGEGSSVPRVNIVETNDDFKVEMAAPGMSKKDFHVELDNDMLTILSEMSSDTQGRDQSFTRKEFSYQSFKRSFYLPNMVESDMIEAKYKDGILSLTIPKKEEAKKKPIKTIAIS